MEKTQEIIKHLLDLYGDKENTDEDILNWCEKNMERYNAWKDAFTNYDLFDVFRAIDEYWRFTSNKTKPTVAKLLAMLNTNKSEQVKKEEPKQRYICPESEWIQRDIKAGKNTDCLLSHYRRAIDYITKNKLPEFIGWSEYSKIEPEQRYLLALRNGLFDGFDETLRQIKEFNIDC